MRDVGSYAQTFQYTHGQKCFCVTDGAHVQLYGQLVALGSGLVSAA